VGGEKENAFAASVGALEVFKAVIDDDAGDIFAGVAGEEADFGELASERNEFSANQTAALALGHFGEGEREVAHANAAQAPVKRVDGQPEGDADGARRGTGEHAQGLYPGPD
jgi:hypothetical protein